MEWNQRFTDRVTRIEPSATIAIGNQAASLEADGVDVIDLSVGEPDFETPDVVIESAKQALDAGHHGYTSSNGVPELKEAISETFARDGLTYDADQIIVTPGGKQALFEVISALIEENDEVVLLDPAWVSYEAIVKIAGGSLQRVDLEQHEFRLEPALDDLAAAVTDRTRLMVVNSPNNPSGKVYSQTALRGVRDLAVDNDLVVISDEIYKRIVYGTDYRSLGSLDGMNDRTVTVNGFSKPYAMTGWRLGYVGAPTAVIEEAGKLQSHSVTCAVNFVQRAGVTALREADDAVNEMVATFEDRRDLLLNRLADEGIRVPEPEGAFYLMLPVSENDQEWCERAIEEAHVATVPGRAFGTPGYARISYAAGSDRLIEGVDRLVDSGLL